MVRPVICPHQRRMYPFDAQVERNPPMNEREVIGGNQAPSQIDFSRETVEALSEWMKSHPVIDDEDTARDGKSL